ncbi:hypothetical protein F4820DRAFT_441886 [Hypoxylon rubiginosum]|uniref:Uncharacterized protein n=1 Tax=Hypoxylon rubiginosum TaxID=110542 RepID=A0ACB9YHK8_9PEZI|nr:hypothetical protein F4820DRAFT_441886 [Hypoxylon rubiginosum]
MTLKFGASTLKRIISNLEVEHKFNPGPKFSSCLANRAWNTYQTQRPKCPFTVLSRPDQLIRDTYYDTEDGLLSKLGLWVRQRYIHIPPPDPARLITGNQALAAATGNDTAAQWNAKSRLGGHYSNSQFVELDGKADVAREVLRITEAKTKLEDLRVTTDLQTRRSAWEVVGLVDGTAPSAKMTIVVDAVTEAEAGEDGIDEHSPFNHTIGEVELFEEVITEGKGDAEHEAHRKAIAAQRTKELEEFILAHPNLFSTNPKPIGKLAAYNTWRAARS